MLVVDGVFICLCLWLKCSNVVFHQLVEAIAAFLEVMVVGESDQPKIIVLKV